MKTIINHEFSAHIKVSLETLSTSEKTIETAAKLCIESLKKGNKILGICLGMQWFAQKGAENGECNGLGFIPGVVDRFNFRLLTAKKIIRI